MNMRADDTQQLAARPAPHPVRVLVADDHRVVVMGIARTLEAHADIEVAACAHSVAELMSALHDTTYDVLLCDYSFNDSDQPDGLPMLQRIRRLWPDLRIILLTSQDDMGVINHVLQLGVTGFLSKRSGDFAELAAIVRNAARGVRYMDKSSQAMVGWFLALSGGCGEEEGDGSGIDGNGGHHHTGPRSAPDTAAAVADHSLTPQELDLARLFCSGVTLSEIAQTTGAGLKGICACKQSLMKKLGVASDVELVSAFRQLGGARR